MGLLDVLAKLGIVRYGAKAATYTSGADRPTELQMEGVFNAERDLVSPASKGTSSKQPETPDKSGR
jgi:hypothetical protein